MNGHPAMMKVSDERRIKSPPALALVFVVMAWTVPPCGHIMTLDELRRPGIKVSFVFCVYSWRWSKALSHFTKGLALIFVIWSGVSLYLPSFFEAYIR